MPSDIIDEAIRSQLKEISVFIWDELKAFNLPNGESRVFCNTISNVQATTNFDKPISIYPNPSKDFFSIRNVKKNQYIQISDIEGKIIYASQNDSDKDFNIPLSKNQSGVYILTITNADKTLVFSERLIKL